MSNDRNSRDEWDAMAEVTRRPLPAHAQRLTTEDRDGRPISPTCAHCGRAKERCAGTVVTPEVQREAAEIVAHFADRLGMWQGYPLIDAIALALAARGTTTAGLRAEVERLRGEVTAERAAVVAWLRAEVDDDDNAGGPLACILAYAAKAIERGEHRREGGE